eukprot:3526-Heterococcus_DN1.PRE.4
MSTAESTVPPFFCFASAYGHLQPHPCTIAAAPHLTYGIEHTSVVAAAAAVIIVYISMQFQSSSPVVPAVIAPAVVANTLSSCDCNSSIGRVRHCTLSQYTNNKNACKTSVLDSSHHLLTIAVIAAAAAATSTHRARHKASILQRHSQPIKGVVNVFASSRSSQQQLLTVSIDHAAVQELVDIPQSLVGVEAAVKSLP